MNYTANDNLAVMKAAKNYNQFLIDSILSVTQKRNTQSILDFGCNDGFFMECVTKARPSLQACGIEIDEESLEKCKQKGLQVTTDLARLDTRFDVIYSLNTLEHIEKDCDILKLMHDKLSDGGYLYIYVPALMFLFSSMDKKVGHFRRYTQKELARKLSECGFEVERAEYCDSLGVLATLLYIVKDKLGKNNQGNINKNLLVLYDRIFPISRLLDKLLFKHFLGKNVFAVARKKQ